MWCKSYPYVFVHIKKINIIPLCASPTKWSNTLKHTKWLCLTVLWHWHFKDYQQESYLVVLLVFPKCNFPYFSIDHILDTISFCGCHLERFFPRTKSINSWCLTLCYWPLHIVQMRWTMVKILVPVCGLCINVCN